MATDTGTRRTRATEGKAEPMIGDLESLRTDLVAVFAEHGLKIKTWVAKTDYEKRQQDFSLKTIPAALDVQGELFDDEDE